MNTNDCIRCDGTGLLCNVCGESEAICIGDCEPGSRLCGHFNCPDCDGSGESLPSDGRKPKKRKR